MSDTIALYAKPTIAYNDGARIESLGSDNYGNLLVNQVGGKFFEWARRGFLFLARTAAPAAIPIDTTLTNAPTLWNPSDSNKIIVPLKLIVVPEGEGTVVIHGLTLCHRENMGHEAGSGLPFASFTNVAPVCTRFGDKETAKAKFAGAVVTWTAQPTIVQDLGMGLWTDGTPASNGPFSQMEYEFDGSIIMMPGTAIALGAGVASSTTYTTSILYAELPMFSM